MAKLAFDATIISALHPRDVAAIFQQVMGKRNPANISSPSIEDLYDPMDQSDPPVVSISADIPHLNQVVSAQLKVWDRGGASEIEVWARKGPSLASRGAARNRCQEFVEELRQADDSAVLDPEHGFVHPAQIAAAEESAQHEEDLQADRAAQIGRAVSTLIPDAPTARQADPRVRLEQLEQLRADGFVSDAEYQVKRQEILNTL